jgi:serine/threonine-protein kinase
MVGSIALSPDGRKLAYISTDGIISRLYVRHLDQLEASPMPGTEGALNPFFSSDGEWVGFAANGVLYRISLTSGERATLSQVASIPSGASWGEGNTILYSSSFRLMRLPAAGGTPLEVTNRQIGVTYGLPHFLPGGKEALVTMLTRQGSHIGVFSLESGELTMLEGLGEGTTAEYVATGHIVYGARGRLMAVPFDLERREILGDPVPVADDVYTMPGGRAFFSVSRNGDLAYVSGGEVDRRLVFVDRNGNAVPSSAGPRFASHPRFSPRGSLLSIAGGPGLARDIWTVDLKRGTRSRLTTEDQNVHSTWSPDGTRIAYASGNRIVWRAADGSGETEVLADWERTPFPSSFSPDGSLLAFWEANPATGVDIRVVPIQGDRKPIPFLETSFNESYGTFSPDGRYMAYTSDESGRFEVYVRPYPGPGGKVTVSTDGGSEACWSRDGKELFYRRGGSQVLSVPVTTEAAFTAGKPRVLFEGDYGFGSFGDAHYDVSPDGKTFAMVETGDANAPTRIDVVVNWGEELKRLAPVELPTRK